MDQLTPEEIAKIKAILACLGDATAEQIGAMFAAGKAAAEAAAKQSAVEALMAKRRQIDVEIQQLGLVK